MRGVGGRVRPREQGLEGNPSVITVAHISLVSQLPCHAWGAVGSSFLQGACHSKPASPQLGFPGVATGAWVEALSYQLELRGGDRFLLSIST